jgi:hypothetical protein
MGWEMSLLRALAKFVHLEIYPDPFPISEDYDDVEMVEVHKTKRWEVVGKVQHKITLIRIFIFTFMYGECFIF